MPANSARKLLLATTLFHVITLFCDYSNRDLNHPLLRCFRAIALLIHFYLAHSHHVAISSHTFYSNTDTSLARPPPYNEYRPESIR
ncbi:hypothetical protein [Sclerotinia sclerotiorum reovirus 1]|nr:hypothetical protein [Sclerotinia sclerotiorum reovirus 1]